MDIRIFNPYVRFCSSVWMYGDYAKVARAYDYRLFYVISGGFYAQIEEKVIDVCPGTVLLIPPGIGYKLNAKECGKSNHIIVNFDFVYNNVGSPTKMIFEPDKFHENEIYSNECIAPFEDVFCFENAYFAMDILNAMCVEKNESADGANEMLSAYMKLLLVKISRESAKRVRACDNTSFILCEKIKEYIKKGFTGVMNNTSVAQKFGYHQYYLNTIFKKNTGYTLHSYITECRISYAKELLLTTSKSVCTIASESGFKGASYFSECFTGLLGVTPSQYRNRAK